MPSNNTWNSLVRLLDILSALDIKSVWDADEDEAHFLDFFIRMGRETNGDVSDEIVEQNGSRS